MALKCELLDRCGFFKKYQPIEELACKWLVQEYCQGTRMDECRRKEYLQRHGKLPSDDMMPSGKNVPRQNEHNLS